MVLWLAGGMGDIDESLRRQLADPRNEVYVAVASLWEMSIKAGLGKLDLPDDPEQMCAQLGLVLLDLRAAHVRRLATLPALHRDPFDRILIASALAEGLVLVSRDRAVLAYPVATLAV